MSDKQSFIMKHSLIHLVLLLSTAASLQAVAQQPSANFHDMKDRDFTAEEVIRSLKPVPSDDAAESQHPVRKTRGPKKRGLEVMKTESGAAEPPITAPATRRLSMQLNFDFDSAVLTESSRTRLDAVGIALQSQELSALKLIVSGHTDVTGRYEYNLNLSKRRAESVVSYLISRHGVAARRLVPVGRASDELLDAANPAGSVNRRVQIETVN